MFFIIKEKEGDLCLTLRDHLFGYNLGATTLQILMAGGALIVTYVVIGLIPGEA